MPKLLKFLLHVSRPIHLLRWIVFFMVVAILWATVENPTLQAYLQERDRTDDYRGQVDQLQQQQQQWQAEVADLKAGGYRLEKAIHDRLPMLRPGQKELIFRAPGEKPEAEPELEPFDPAALPELPAGDPAESDGAAATTKKNGAPAAPASAAQATKAAKTKDAPSRASGPAKTTRTQKTKTAKPAAQ